MALTGKQINKLVKTDRFKRTWHSYVKKYNRAQRVNRRHGAEMVSEKMSKKDLAAVIEIYKDKGYQKNFLSKIVSEQQYVYSRETVKRFQKTAKEMDLTWKDVKYTKLRYGEIDVSAINSWLIENNPDMSGYERAQYISHEVFGSK